MRDDGTQAFTAQCRAAIVTGLGEPLPYPTHGDRVDSLPEEGAELVDLCVFNPTGMFFNTGVPQDERPTTAAEAGEGGGRQGGTWHWPERV